MHTHNRLICHCVHCGQVLHVELNDIVPECCGHRMIRAAAETVAGSHASGAATDTSLAGTSRPPGSTRFGPWSTTFPDNSERPY